MDKSHDSLLIDALGGTSRTALMFDIEPASVSGWRKGGIPKGRLLYIKLAHPELFDVAGNFVLPDVKAC